MKLVILENHALKDGDLDWGSWAQAADEVDIHFDTPQQAVAEALQGADACILNKRHITAEILDACPTLKWIGLLATGYDNIDIEAASRHGVVVANIPGYSTASVAQMVFSLLLAVCQCPERWNSGIRAGYWKDQPAPYACLPQVELCGKTFGVFGYGAIGRAAARIAKGFGMQVIACTRTMRPEYKNDGVTFVDFNTLLAESDVLSLHCPATPQTIGMVNAAALEKMKRGAILVNTARGAIIDEQAVADACRSGRLAWYLADAYAQEPLPQDSPLREPENILLTPHVAWSTKQALDRLMVILRQNYDSWLAGKPQNQVNL